MAMPPTSSRPTATFKGTESGVPGTWIGDADVSWAANLVEPVAAVAVPDPENPELP
jgi:hypothetical protein